MAKERLVIITGVSGSGKSTALDALEDLGFFCIDNLPAPLITGLVDFLIKLQVGPAPDGSSGTGSFAPSYRDVALLVDCRDENSFPKVQHAIERLQAAGVDVSLLFFESSDEVIIRRFQETRRPHPLLIIGGSVHSVQEAVQKERELLADFRDIAATVLDTSTYSPHDLRRSIENYIGHERALEIVLLSFGFKYGVPHDADLVVDVRFLPNPHFVPGLRQLTGVDKKVEDYVFSSEDSQEFLLKYRELLKFLIPHYQKEGKRYLTIGVGCTGGKHRSVAVSRRLEEGLGASGLKIKVRHRDIERI